MIIRVRTSDEKSAEVLEALRPLGIEATTGEESLQDTILFYIGRMNAKLDNLGQLKHLHKIVGTFGDIRNIVSPIGEFYRIEIEKFQAQIALKEALYDSFIAEYGELPFPRANARYLELEDLRKMFPFQD